MTADQALATTVQLQAKSRARPQQTEWKELEPENLKNVVKV